MKTQKLMKWLWLVIGLYAIILHAGPKASWEHVNSNTISGKLSKRISISMQTEYRNRLYMGLDIAF